MPFYTRSLFSLKFSHFVTWKHRHDIFFLPKIWCFSNRAAIGSSSQCIKNGQPTVGVSPRNQWTWVMFSSANATCLCLNESPGNLNLEIMDLVLWISIINTHKPWRFSLTNNFKSTNCLASRLDTFNLDSLRGHFRQLFQLPRKMVWGSESFK